MVREAQDWHKPPVLKRGKGPEFSICARGDHIGAPKRQPFMSPAELIIAGELVYGSQWRKPLAKAIGYSRRMIWYYESGERQIPENVAISVRRLADLGPVGSLVRSSGQESRARSAAGLGASDSRSDTGLTSRVQGLVPGRAIG